MIDKQTGPKVSVILPVYNAERFLERCIDSVLAQTFKNFELILIDDGSTDSSGQICDDYSKEDDRVVVIHKVNGGTSDALNKGLDAARGMYIMFCDNDDIVAKDWIRILYDYAEKYPNSLVNCEYATVNNQTGEEKIIKLPGVSKSQFFQKDQYYILYSNRYYLYKWNRIYKSEIIKRENISFDRTMKKGGEDILFNLSYIDHCENFFHITECLYYWINNGTSVSRKYEAHYYSVVKRLYFPRLKLISSEYRQAFYDEYFWRFYNCIEICEDPRNTETNREKEKYCNYILRDEVFIHALDHASDSACGRKLKAILRLKQYKFLKLYIRIFNYSR